MMLGITEHFEETLQVPPLPLPNLWYGLESQYMAQEIGHEWL